jgi:uncharacterized protein YjiS (DUF1127 family)
MPDAGRSFAAVVQQKEPPAMSGFLLSSSGLRPTRTPVTGRAIAQHRMTWLDWLAVTMRAVTTRRQLAQMDDRMLKDIGITRSEALIESGRAPWDLGLPPGAR